MTPAVIGGVRSLQCTTGSAECAHRGTGLPPGKARLGSVSRTIFRYFKRPKLSQMGCKAYQGIAAGFAIAGT